MRLIIIIIVFWSLLNCSSTRTSAPIEDATPFASSPPTHHVVSAGETVYSIALRYEIDYKKLSILNRLGTSHAIHPGQVLDLDVSRVKMRAPRPEAVVTSRPRESAGQSKYLSRSPEMGRSNTSYQEGIRWVWPASGKVLKKFTGDSGLNKGIDIRGKLGEPVLAAANGKVLYSGNRLRGYGKLVILEHNDNFLSAYAHNSALLVEEGDWVKVGQPIAKVGSSDTNTVKLHFEIRFNGKPVDPLRYLPPR